MNSMVSHMPFLLLLAFVESLSTKENSLMCGVPIFFLETVQLFPTFHGVFDY